MAYHGKDLKKRIVALHKDGVGYKKIAKTLKLSCSTVAKTIQRFNRTGSTQNRSWSWSGVAWVLPALGSYSSLKEPWMSIYTVTYWSRAWSPPVGDWAAGQYSNMITTTALLKKLRVKVMDWPSMSRDQTNIKHLWGILKWKVEERKVSNIHQLCDVIMEEWKRTPVATCEALVNSMPKRVKAVLENNGGHTKYWQFGPNLDIFT